MTNFEKFLEEQCFEENPGVLDDDMEDYFESWLGNLDGDDFIRYADMYGVKCAKNIASKF